MFVAASIVKLTRWFRGLTVMTADSDSASEGSTPSETFLFACFISGLGIQCFDLFTVLLKTIEPVHRRMGVTYEFLLLLQSYDNRSGI